MSRFSERWKRWIARRIPPARDVVLRQRQLFIFPTRTGFFFLFCLLIMLLAAINYQNNMSYAMTFLLANLFVIAVLHTYANLAGMRLRAVSAQSVFARQQAQFVVALSSEAGKRHHSVHLEWPQIAEALVAQCDANPVQVHLNHPVQDRGLFKAPRLKISSVYPLGLLRCWSWVDLDLRAVVYPAPVSAPRHVSDDEGGDEGRDREQIAGEDFYGLRDYRQGDALKHIHWQALAKGAGLQSRIYSHRDSVSDWLSWHDYPGLATEQRLSALCAEVLVHDEAAQHYGLRLPDSELPPGSGQSHRLAALKSLALHGVES